MPAVGSGLIPDDVPMKCTLRHFSHMMPIWTDMDAFLPRKSSRCNQRKLQYFKIVNLEAGVRDFYQRAYRERTIIHSCTLPPARAIQTGVQTRSTNRFGLPQRYFSTRTTVPFVRCRTF